MADVTQAQPVPAEVLVSSDPVETTPTPPAPVVDPAVYKDRALNALRAQLETATTDSRKSKLRERIAAWESK